MGGEIVFLLPFGSVRRVAADVKVAKHLFFLGRLLSSGLLGGSGFLSWLFGGEFLHRLFSGFLYGHLKSPLSSAAAEVRKL